LKKLAEKTQDFWIEFLDKYFVSAASVTVSFCFDLHMVGMARIFSHNDVTFILTGDW
jgi:hypothetical protein